MRILLRCDGGPGTGVGHVVRSLALAEVALGRGHEVDLLGRLEGRFLDNLVNAPGGGPNVLQDAEPEDLDGVGLAQVAARYDLLHADQYDITAELLRFIEGDRRGDCSGRRRTILSNVADGSFGGRPADVLVDPTPGAQWSPPPARAGWHLRGARYVALRPGIVALRERADLSHPGGGPLKVLVVMGGSDPLECATLVVDALAATGVDLAVTVVAVPATRAALERRARESWQAGRLKVTAPLPELPEVMASADLVVTAAGTSVWELCALARPMAVVAVVDNQLPGYHEVVWAGAAEGLGRPADLTDPAAAAALLRPLLEDADRRKALAAAAGRLVDGLGAWRVVRAWEEAHGYPWSPKAARGPRVRVRAATRADARMLWLWRNDAGTRASSRSPGEVPFEAHLRWMEATMASPARRLLVGECGGEPVGTVRWDDEGEGEWEVSITVSPRHRGRGLASALLSAAEQWLAGQDGADIGRGEARPEALGLADAEGDGAAVHGALAAYLAVVHEANAASRRLFLRSGYLPDLPPDPQGFERFVKWVTPSPR